MSMGFTTHKHLDLSADDEDPSQLIIRPGWDAPQVRCLPRTFCAWPCLLRQVGTVLGSPCDCIVTGITYANPGSRQRNKLCKGCASSVRIAVWHSARCGIGGSPPVKWSSRAGKWSHSIWNQAKISSTPGKSTWCMD